MYCPGPLVERTMPLTRCSRSVTPTRFVISATRSVTLSTATATRYRQDLARAGPLAAVAPGLALKRRERPASAGAGREDRQAAGHR